MWFLLRSKSFIAKIFMSMRSDYPKQKGKTTDLYQACLRKRLFYLCSVAQELY